MELLLSSYCGEYDLGLWLGQSMDSVSVLGMASSSANTRLFFFVVQGAILDGPSIDCFLGSSCPLSRTYFSHKIKDCCSEIELGSQAFPHGEGLDLRSRALCELDFDGYSLSSKFLGMRKERSRSVCS